ncbi:MAG: hypothetical protein TYPL_3300 [Candidatus Tyloplasma litorale]|nr:MAG: hypothetical protein TYPL_3300 [Mycoplasmatales bacterium]
MNGIDNKILRKKYINSGQYQDILIVGSRVFDTLRNIGFILHVLAFIMGILTLTDIILGGNSRSMEILEIVTLIIIGLIILEHVLFPFSERLWTRYLLRNFWGVNKISTKIISPKIVLLNETFSKVHDEEIKTQVETISINWIKLHKFSLSKIFVIQSKMNVPNEWKSMANENKEMFKIFIPNYLIVDLKRKEIKYHSVLRLSNLDLPYHKEFVFTFNYDKNEATWSGIFPSNPMYGEWEWNFKK